jgi:hypothetical protein
VDRVTVVTRASDGQLLADQTGAAGLGNGGLEGFGRGSEIERPVDVAVRGDQLTGGRDHRHRTVVNGLDQARTDPFGQHRVSGRPKGSVTQIVLVPGDYRTLKLIENAENTLAQLRHLGFEFGQLDRRLR